MLRGIFEHKWDEVIGECRIFYNEELGTKYYLGGKIKKKEIGGECSTDKEGRGSCRILAATRKERRTLRRITCRLGVGFILLRIGTVGEFL